MRIEPARQGDLESMCALLVDAGLPTDGLREHLDTGLVARDGDEMCGCVALELHRDAALLRSLVVVPSQRGAGVARRLTAAALVLGRRAGVTRFYVLTTTAPEFFARQFGFRPVDRTDVSPAVRGSVEFVSACPATATAMVLDESRKTVVFACVHSAGRSQMSAAFFNALADPTRAAAVAAGTVPAERVHPEVVEAMREAGIDLSGARPALLTDELARGAALLVTMGCGESCPVVPGLERVDWELPDPQGQPPERVRAIRDDVRARVLALVRLRAWERAHR